jgi:transposase
MSGVLSCKIVEGSFTTPLFKGFLEGLLNEMQPYPAPNSVIVMDNAKIHRSPEIREIIEARYESTLTRSCCANSIIPDRGMKIVYLPPYSPDFNPIELAFSAIKAYVRRHGNLIRTAMQDNNDLDVYLFLYRAAFHISCDDIAGFYSHCGYV